MDKRGQTNGKSLGDYLTWGAGIGSAIGTSIGVVVGAVTDNTGVGIAMGAAFGAAIGGGLGLLVWTLASQASHVGEDVENSSEPTSKASEE